MIEGALKKMIDDQFSDLPVEFRGEIPKTDHVLGIESQPDCPNGTRGREAVFEMFKMDKDIEKVILENPIESSIQDEIRKKGMITMKEHALIKALEHKIPIEEVNKL
jgi:type II secretory ATPase GspE/PulE/Tfp pilus assembly ATPase PilB-like protein